MLMARKPAALDVAVLIQSTRNCFRMMSSSALLRKFGAIIAEDF
jgi:hypothetical protein